jgi:hypothetical protein
MAAIGPDEIEPSLVVFMDPAAFVADGRVSHTQDPPISRPGPFVCVSVDGEVSEWMPITTEERSERLAIRREWCSGGHPQWLRVAQYLNDGANVWRGPHEAFIEASRKELTDPLNGARVSVDGLAAIHEEAEAQRHRRDRL